MLNKFTYIRGPVLPGRPPLVVLIDGETYFIHNCRWSVVSYRTTTHLRSSDGPWEITSTHPLTLDPSIKCGACETHGYFVAGKWQPCPDSKEF